MKAKNTFGDSPDVNPDDGGWVDAFRNECIKNLNTLAFENGVMVISLEVMSRKLDGGLGKMLEREAEEVLATQIKVRATSEFNVLY